MVDGLRVHSASCNGIKETKTLVHKEALVSVIMELRSKRQTLVHKEALVSVVVLVS